MDIYELEFDKQLKRGSRPTIKRNLSMIGGDLNDFMYIKDGKLYIKDENGDYNVDGGGADATPSGVVNPYAGATAPTGWLLCDGSAISRGTYADLFTVIGTTEKTADLAETG